MEIILANPRGFCAGVDRAIQIVEKALEKFGTPLYVRHEIVHNKAVVSRLRSMGAIFVDELSDVPSSSNVVFSAHGVAESVYVEAEAKKLNIIDAACPLVKKVHNSAKRHDAKGDTVILIGHAGHSEVEGTLGQLDGTMLLVSNTGDVEKLDLSPDLELAYITQTTLSIDETKEIIDSLKEKFPNIKGPQKGDLCYATTNRQGAVKELASRVDLFLIVGSANSSNSNRLRELAESLDVKAYLIENSAAIENEWFANVKSVGISSGASAPEHLVQEVVESIENRFSDSKVIDSVYMVENVKFSLPKALQ